MGSGGKTYTYNADYTAQNASAERAKTLWSRYEEQYLPILTELTSELGSHPEELDAAVERSNQKFDQSAQGVYDTLAMYGTQLNPIQRQALTSKLNAAKTLGAATARTKQRRTINDRNEELQEALVGEGADIRGLSNEALDTAANLEQERNTTGYGIAAAKTARSSAKAQATAGTIGNVVGTGLTAAALFG